MQVAIAEAKAKFAELVRRAEAGEPIELTRHGRPVARIVATPHAEGSALIGALAGRMTVPDPTDGDAEIAEMFGVD